MIEVERVNGQKIVVNSDLIQLIESSPDTIVTFENGSKVILRTPASEIIRKVIDFKRQISGMPPVR